VTEQLGLLVIAFGWPPSETDRLTLDEVTSYAELARTKLRIAGVLK